jgi:DNA-binding HxlR family transcriptional regulator
LPNLDRERERQQNRAILTNIMAIGFVLFGVCIVVALFDVIRDDMRGTSTTQTTSASVTQMIDALARDGLVTREDHAHDRRSVLITMTPDGKRLFETALRVHHQHIEHALSGISEKERQTLTTLLARVGTGFRSEDTV